MSPPSAARIVINADDLGRTESVNSAILESFERTMITSTSIMANMPAFDQAVSIIGGAGFNDRVGVHLNLTEGLSLSEPIRSVRKFCDSSGQFRSRGANLWFLSRSDQRAIEAEFAAQIDMVLSAGIKPSHLDSHQHFHTQWPVGPIVIRLARRYQVPAIRLSRNCGPSSGVAKQMYKTVFNARIIRSGLAPTRHFGNAQDAASLTHLAGAIEVMVHPDLDRAGRVVDALSRGEVDGAPPLEPVSAHWRKMGSLLSFRELCTL